MLFSVTLSVIYDHVCLLLGLHISRSQPILDALVGSVREGRITTLCVDNNTGLDYNMEYIENALKAAAER